MPESLKLELLNLLGVGVQIFFVFAFGACVGSLTNVLVYRMPKGLGVVSPPSRCPKCDTKLSWRDNIPVFGWVFLRGKCRYCKVAISPEYPLVELSVGMLWVLLFSLWYLVGANATFLGVDWGSVRPEWALNGLGQTWPEFVVLVGLMSSLFAMLLMDLKTFTVRLELAWVPVGVAVLFMPAHAAWIEHNTLLGEWYHHSAMSEWSMPLPGMEPWDWIGVAIGATVGLLGSIVLMRVGLIGRSFADYDEWEKGELARIEQERAVSGEKQPEADDPHMWIRYPKARREMVREMAFLGPPVALGLVGTQLGGWLGVAAYPLWAQVLGGVLLGYLIGGGVVWGVRILGTLLFGKEAMGLGDVHVVAAIGACLGWIDAVLAFFAAAFVGLAFALIGSLTGGRIGRMLPYIPCLAIATLLVLLCKPLIEQGLSNLTHGPVDLP